MAPYAIRGKMLDKHKFVIFIYLYKEAAYAEVNISAVLSACIYHTCVALMNNKS